MENTLNNWITEELEQQKTTTIYEKKPALKLKANTVTKVVIDFSVKFTEWTDEKDRIKAIVPVKAKDETGKVVDMVWWLNKKNPIYSAILKAYASNQNPEFLISTTGTQDETKYTLVDGANL